MKTDWQKHFMELVKPFMKSSAGEEQAPPPSAEDPGTGEATDGISDQFLDKLKSAIETGEVVVEEAAIKGYAKSNGLSDEDCDTLWATISEGVNDDAPAGEPDGDETTPPSSTPPANADVQKGGNKEINDEFIQFAKSIGSAIQSAEVHEMAIAGLVEENLVLSKENQEMKADIGFLKSQMSKVLGAPVDQKNPVTDISGVPATPAKSEIIQEIVKGVRDKKLALGDLQTYKSTGRQTAAVTEFLKSSKGGN